MDDEFASLADVPWYFDKDGYVRRSAWQPETKRLKNMTLHRVVLGSPVGGVVDHKNGNRLDCRMENLRLTTHQANMHNRSPLSGRGTSRHRGVVWNSKAGKWQVQVGLDGRLNYLGLYGTEQEAADAASAWRRENMPDSLQEIV